MAKKIYSDLDLQGNNILNRGNVDARTLNSNDPADGPVNFAKQEATALVIENRTSDPATPVDGQIWLRTDL